MNKKAYAKINLRLKVLGKTTNNYHLLQMLNARVFLHDTLVFKKTKKPGIKVYQKDLEMTTNTVYKVITYMFDKYSLSGGVTVKVKKRIPYGAGLAGGSVDAATTIKAINELYHLELSIKDMEQIALKIGTDTVYALYDNICLVEGIGEIVKPMEYNINKEVLIINPGINIVTKEIYDSFNNKYSKADSFEELQKMPIEKLLDNDLEKVVFEKYQEVFELREYLKSFNSLVLMSGSGSSVYILGENLSKVSKEVKRKYPTYKRYLTKIKGE